jgi:hypothetical protein
MFVDGGCPNILAAFTLRLEPFIASLELVCVVMTSVGSHLFPTLLGCRLIMQTILLSVSPIHRTTCFNCHCRCGTNQNLLSSTEPAILLRSSVMFLEFVSVPVCFE